MLFATVYGPELEQIYRYIARETERSGGVERRSLIAAFVPKDESTKTLDDAISFLTSAGMVSPGKQNLQAEPLTRTDFRLELLYRLRQIQLGLLKPEGWHKLDPRFMEIMEAVFMVSSTSWQSDLDEAVRHSPRNFDEVRGEKVDVWARVMEDGLGLGRRVDKAGFLLTIPPDLILAIAQHLQWRQSTLESFLEQGVGQYLPWATQDGDIAPAIRSALGALRVEGRIQLNVLVDSPSRSFWPPHHYREIIFRGV